MKPAQTSLITHIVVGVTTTIHRQHLSVPAIANTWGSDFAHVHFFSERGDPALGIVQCANDPTKQRASAEEMATLKYLAETYPDAPWYYKADDDAYLHASKLADIASRYDSTGDWYIGQPLQYDRGNATFQKYCAGGVGYLISNGLMKRIVASLMQPIESCCSDVQVGTLVQRALQRGDDDDICTQPPSDTHIFFASGSPVRPAGLDTTFNLTVLHNLVVNDGMRHMLRTGVGFHYVTSVEQYVVRSLYAMHGMRAHERHRHGLKTPL
jgi:Fringe-like